MAMHAKLIERDYRSIDFLEKRKDHAKESGIIGLLQEAYLHWHCRPALPKYRFCRRHREMEVFDVKVPRDHTAEGETVRRNRGRRALALKDDP
jgi:hypothetical protein